MNKNKLQQYYPIIRTREAVLADINSRPGLRSMFRSWEKEVQEYFLDFVTGVKGIKTLYDTTFKEVLNPETVPERLNFFLSCLLREKVKVLRVLPLDNSRLADETSLVIMDIVVQLSDGRIVNVEIQKVGYLFPGQRCACYSSDLLLRQYKAARDKAKNKHFSYKSLNAVYTIVLFDKSTREFSEYPDVYVHRFEQKSDSGLKIDFLQKYLLIPLDIFRKNLHNKGIRSDLDAWLAFLGEDDPDIVYSVIKYHPVFEAMYRHLYEICQNVEDVMNMFSKELQIMDRNTVQLMIDEMQDTINDQKDTINDQKDTINNQQRIISEQDIALSEKDAVIARLQAIIADNSRKTEGIDSQG